MNSTKYWYTLLGGDIYNKLTKEESDIYKAGDVIQIYHHLHLCRRCGTYFYHNTFSETECCSCYNKIFAPSYNKKYDKEYEKYLKTKGHLINVRCIEYGIKNINGQDVPFINKG